MTPRACASYNVRMSNADVLLSTAEAADLLKVSVFQVARLVKRGDLPTAFQAPGLRGARVFRLSDVDAFLATRTTGAS